MSLFSKIKNLISQDNEEQVLKNSESYQRIRAGIEDVSNEIALQQASKNLGEQFAIFCLENGIYKGHYVSKEEIIDEMLSHNPQKPNFAILGFTEYMNNWMAGGDVVQLLHPQTNETIYVHKSKKEFHFPNLSRESTSPSA